MKKYFVICTSTCIKEGKVCNVGDVIVHVQGKSNYMREVTNDPDFIPHHDFGYSSSNIAERYAVAEQKNMDEFEHRMEKEYGYTRHWKYEFTTKEVKYA